MSCTITREPVHMRDLAATVWHAPRLEHERLSDRFQGLDQRLTGVDPAKAIRDRCG